MNPDSRDPVPSVAWLRRNPETARQVETILHLPDDRWTDLEISFGNAEPAVAHIGLLLTGEQLVALAELAVAP